MRLLLYRLAILISLNEVDFSGLPFSTLFVLKGVKNRTEFSES